MGVGVGLPEIYMTEEAYIRGEKRVMLNSFHEIMYVYALLR